MSGPRFFAGQLLGDSQIALEPADEHHLFKVLRARPGEPFSVVLGDTEFQCEVAEGGGGLVVGSRPLTGEPPLQITLFQGLAKGDKMEWIVQKGTELGVTQFVPVATERAVVKLDAKKAASRVERWQRIAAEAAGQCRRGRVPDVAPLCSWAEAVAQVADYDLALVAYEGGGQALSHVTAEPAPKKVALFIGPEGGLSAGEVEAAVAAGAQVISLGPRILRTETAGLVAATALLFAWGDLG